MEHNSEYELTLDFTKSTDEEIKNVAWSLMKTGYSVYLSGNSEDDKHLCITVRTDDDLQLIAKL